MTTNPKIRKFKHTFHNTALNSAPQPPSEIQTSLLQVGMRVRKAISQGYRTQWAIEEQKFQLHGLRYKKQNATITIWEGQPGQAENQGTSTIPSSQESTASIASNLSAGALYQYPVLQLRMKRGYLHDEEHAEGEERMDAISTHLRPIAQASSRRKFVVHNPSKVLESATTEIEFEDAAFLDPGNRERVDEYAFEGLT